MNLQRSLLGTITGALAALGAQVAIEGLGGTEALWAPLLIGLLVGWCVRKFDRSALSGVSYTRGALGAAVALGTIMVGPYLVGQVRTAMAPRSLPGASGSAAQSDGSSSEAPGMSGSIESNGENRGESTNSGKIDVRGSGPLDEALAQARRPGQFSVWQFVFMAVGILLAYELARGTELHYEPIEPDASPSPAAEDKGE